MTPSTWGLVSIGALSVLAVAPGHAQTSSTESPSASIPDRPGVVYAERRRATATVEAIDASRRTVTLKRADGQTFTLKVPPPAPNFDQVRVGDTVAAEYLESVAIDARKADAPPPATESAAVGLAPEGETPGGMIVSTMQVTARVEAVDLARRMLTLRGPPGVRTIIVDDRVSRLDEIKPGDEVVVRYTEAVAIAIVR